MKKLYHHLIIRLALWLLSLDNGETQIFLKDERVRK